MQVVIEPGDLPKVLACATGQIWKGVPNFPDRPCCSNKGTLPIVPKGYLNGRVTTSRNPVRLKVTNNAPPYDQQSVTFTLVEWGWRGLNRENRSLHSTNYQVDQFDKEIGLSKGRGL